MTRGLTRRGWVKLAVVASLGVGASFGSRVWAADAAAKPKILFLTHSQGFKHGSLATAEAVTKELGKRSGKFEVDTVEGYKQDPKSIDLKFFSADYLKPYAGVMFYTTGELPLDDSQKKALIDFVKNGGAFIGAHSAADTFYTWKDYGELLGGYFAGHGRNDRVLILKVEDTKHPATRMLGNAWPMADEFYHYGMPGEIKKGEVPFSRSRVRVLLSVDTEHSDLTDQAGMERGKDYPLAWCHEFGKGRSFYTALGHREDVWMSPVYQEHLLGGILWALGLEPGDATPKG